MMNVDRQDRNGLQCFALGCVIAAAIASCGGNPPCAPEDRYADERGLTRGCRDDTKGEESTAGMNSSAAMSSGSSGGGTQGADSGTGSWGMPGASGWTETTTGSTGPSSWTENANSSSASAETGTSGETSESSGTGTPPEPPLCGNGVVEEGEECDDMNMVDDDGCTALCTQARCGDGIVWAEKEECDDENLDVGDGCGKTCRNEYVMFATSSKHAGNIGSISDADEICHKEAMAGGLEGTYVAWLGSGFDFAGADLPWGKPLIRRDGEPIVQKAEDLVQGWATALVNPVNLTANKDEKKVAGSAWTGTLGLGFNGANCWNWTSDSADWSGVIGYVDEIDEGWTHAEELACNVERHIYCFRQRDW